MDDDYEEPENAKSPAKYQRPKAPNAKRYTGDGSGNKRGRFSWNHNLLRGFSGSGEYAQTVRSIKAILTSPKFDAAMGIVIVLNSVSIGLEMSYELEGKDTVVFQVAEHVFLTIYMLELGMRFFCYGLLCLQNPWVAFDFVLVVVGVLSAWIIMPLSGSLPAGIGPLMVLRIMRLFRLARAIRLLVQFKTLWMLVCGLLSCAGTISYTFLLGFLVIYVWACLGIELIAKHPLCKFSKGACHADADPEEVDITLNFQEAVETYFNSVPRTMLTFVRFVFIDNSCDVYTPIVNGDGRMIIYFQLFTAVVSIALLNLVTAVVVETALEQAASDREMQSAHEEQKKKLLVKDLRDLFEKIDTDKSGTLSKDEIDDAPEDIQKMMISLFKDARTYDDVKQTMQVALDIDKDGFISLDEFLEGICRMVFGKIPQELLSIHKNVIAIHGAFKSVKNARVSLFSNAAENDWSGDNEGPVHETPGPEGSPRAEQKSVAPQAKELLEMWHSVEGLLAQIRGSLQKKSAKTKHGDENVDSIQEGFEVNEDFPEGSFRATVWNSRQKKQGVVVGDDGEPPVHEMVEENLSFQELLAENLWLRNQLMDRALAIDEIKDLLRNKDMHLEKVMENVVKEVGKIATTEPPETNSTNGYGHMLTRDLSNAILNCQILNSGFGPGRKTAKTPMKSVEGDTGDFDAQNTGDDPLKIKHSSWKKVHNTQIASYQSKAAGTKDTFLTHRLSVLSQNAVQSVITRPVELSRERLVELVGFTLRTSPGAKEKWQSRGGGELNPNACSKQMLMSFLQDVNPDLLRFVRDSPANGDKK